MTIESEPETSLDRTIDKLPEVPQARQFSGKVRESYSFENGTRAIVVTDRISAFDYVLGTIPLKGHVLNAISQFWFSELQKIGVPSHHLVSPHPNVSINTEVDVLPIEFVVRSYLTGSTVTSSWYAYQNNNRTICGIEMPEGMRKNEKLPAVILTPTTKAGKDGRDENISRYDIISNNIVSRDVYDKAEEYALKMFGHGQKVAAEKGLILVDTKYEMGLTKEGELIVADEVHTPDSSRYWIAETYETRMEEMCEPDSLDKEFVRNMIVDAGYDVNSTENPGKYMSDEIRLAACRKYLQLYEIFLGHPLTYAEPEISIKDAILSAKDQS
ncbi:MAG: phosphoribosylaminoimidazolesuccinocarboxamide synthase [Pseudomonadota bacterium]